MHASYCTHKGYLTASAPAAPPPAAPAASVLPEMCCGGTCVRAVCEYHGPKTVTYRAEDVALTIGGIVIKGTVTF
jgi:hypothetical protein